MTSTESILAALRKRLQFSEGRVPHDASDMIFEKGQAQAALLYSLLFVPELTMVDNSVLLTNGSSDIATRFLDAKTKSGMPLDRLEASFNLIEIPFLFANGDFQDDEERLLAEKIAEALQRAVAAFCPDRHFIVNIVPAEENAGNIAVEFFESR